MTHGGHNPRVQMETETKDPSYLSQSESTEPSVSKTEAVAEYSDSKVVLILNNFIHHFGIMLDAFKPDKLTDEAIKQIDVAQFTFLAGCMHGLAVQMNRRLGRELSPHSGSVAGSNDPRYVSDFTEVEAG